LTAAVAYPVGEVRRGGEQVGGVGDLAVVRGMRFAGVRAPGFDFLCLIAAAAMTRSAVE